MASGTIKSRVTVQSVRAGRYLLVDEIVGIVVNDKDRMVDLKACVIEPRVSFEWNHRGQRSGAMSPLTFRKSMPTDMLEVFSEAGLYLCEFPSTPVKVGDSWTGSTTATGGCTSGFYTLKSTRFEIGREVANIEVTKIAMANVDQVGPMTMKVDVHTGIPISVDYQVRGKKSGKLSRFTQTWLRS